ncbi:MAG: formate dehydrogenase [Burkholderiales bacterium PBB4]|nr:MAG: formate dehydrogenase [Burkholderiales bacterium PBB4]
MVSPENAVSRRRLFAAASTLGAVAAAVSVLPSVDGDPVPAPEALPAPKRGGGYVLSEHIKRYYKTTLV